MTGVAVLIKLHSVYIVMVIELHFGKMLIITKF